MEYTREELEKAVKKVEDTAIQMYNGYAGLTPDLEVWTYGSQPYSSDLLCGAPAETTWEPNPEWRRFVVDRILSVEF